MKGVRALVAAVTAATYAFSSLAGDHVCACCPAVKSESRETRISQDVTGITTKSLAEEIFVPRPFGPIAGFLAICMIVGIGMVYSFSRSIHNLIPLFGILPGIPGGGGEWNSRPMIWTVERRKEK